MDNLAETQPDEQKSALRHLFTPAFWRSLAAVSLVLVTTSFMNISVFPQFDAVFSPARDISVLTNSVVLLAIGLIATFRPSLLRVRMLNAALLVALAVGAVGLPVSLALGNAVLLVAAACLLSVGRAWCIMLAGVAASRLTLAQAGVLVPLAFVAQAAASLLARVLTEAAGFAAFLVIPFVTWWLSWPDARPILQQTEQGDSPHDFSVTRPSSFLPLASQLFVCLFLFRVAFGCSLRFGEVGGVPLSPVAAIVPVAVVTLYVLVTGKRFPADLMTRVSVLFVVAGFLAMTMELSGFQAATVSLLSVGNTLFDMVAWLVLIAVASRNSRGAVAAFAWGRGVAGLGTTLGAAVGLWANELAGLGTPLFDVLAAAIILLFVGYALFGLHAFSFEEVVDGVTPVEDAVATAPAPTFDERCQAVARRYELTPRELEVFQMLARGRDRTYIQEQLVVSRNTVKAHVKHIYAKLDIHSHQDLIDLVETEA